LGLSLNLGGPTYVASASLYYFVLPELNLEAGGGIWGYYLGPEYHFGGFAENEKTTLYTGLVLCALPPSPNNKWPSGGNEISNSWTIPPQKTHFGVYVPVGFNTIYRNGYTFAFEIAFNSINKEFTSFPLWFSLKFGYHFKKHEHKNY